MIASFTSTSLFIHQNGTVHLQGTRHLPNGMWTVDLANQQPHPLTASIRQQIFPTSSQANSVYELTKKKDIINFLHKAAFSPVPSTWIKAIDSGFFSTWPGLTSKLVRQHLDSSVATAKGHMRTSRKNLRSTKTVSIPTLSAPHDMTAAPAARDNDYYVKVTDLTGKVSTDQTGCFPITSSRGNKYIMVLYCHDANAILTRPLKTKSALHQLEAIQSLHQFLASRGLSPKLHVLDNECPTIVSDYLRTQRINFQLVPPHIHRTNAAEKAIGTFKDHFVSGLCSVDPHFPLHLWCRLLPLATTTLNLLRPARLNPRLSAEAFLNGAFDYNKTPLAPPGTKVLLHETPLQRTTWAPHGVDGWYLGAAPNHYRCHRIYVPRTRAERIGHSVRFFPHDSKLPNQTSAEHATAAALALVKALQHPAPSHPFPPSSDTATALQQLADLFLQTSTKPEPSLPSIVRPAPQKSPRMIAKPPRVLAAPPRVAPAKPSPPIATFPSSISPVRPTPIPPRDSSLPVPVFRRRITRQHPHPEPRYPLRSRQQINLAQQAPAQANAVLDSSSGNLLEYRHLCRGPDQLIWTKALANDLGRLAQGVGTRMPTGSNTIFFISPDQIPPNKKVTYARLVASLRPNKTETHRVRVTVGGDRLDYSGITSTKTAGLSTVKIHLNSVISTPQARYLTLDIKDYYYSTVMSEFEYMRLPLDLIPPEIQQQYNLLQLARNDWVYVEIRQGMPGLKQAGKLANDQLTTHLAKFGYAPCQHTPALWTHHTSPISFTLVVDDFGVKYIDKQNAQHLIDALRARYAITVDWTGTSYLGLTIAWDYPHRHVDISMPDYIPQALQKFKHSAPSRPVGSPAKWIRPIYGATTQWTTPPDLTSKLTPSEINHVQSVVGTLLYYAFAVDSFLLVALSDLAAAQAHGTVQTMNALIHLLNYAATFPRAVVRFHASDMVLHVHSDASYLSAAKARSRVGGHYFLSNASLDPAISKPNGAIHVIAKILKNVMGSAAEAEIGATYVNGQEAIPLRTTLAELGHPQPSTPMQVDNTTAVGFANDTIKQKRSKAIDMQFYWIRDRAAQGQFTIYWRPGTHNLGDLHTKIHPPSHYSKMRPTFQHVPTNMANAGIQMLPRGCDNYHGPPCVGTNPNTDRTGPGSTERAWNRAWNRPSAVRSRPSAVRLPQTTLTNPFCLLLKYNSLIS